MSGSRRPLVHVSLHLGHTADGLQALTGAHTLVEQHKERRWEAEIRRLRGGVLLQHPGVLQAEAALAQVEASGNPLVRTYWRWSWATRPFDVYPGSDESAEA